MIYWNMKQLNKIDHDDYQLSKKKILLVRRVNGTLLINGYFFLVILYACELLITNHDNNVIVEIKKNVWLELNVYF